MGYPPKINLAAARVNAGLEQQAAAEKLGVTAQTLRSWERGETLPDYGKVCEIETLYKYPKDYIFFGKRSL